VSRDRKEKKKENRKENRKENKKIKIRSKTAGFQAMLKLNIKRRATDGFAVGYNIVFPFLIILLLGVLCRNQFKGEITSYQYYTLVSIPFCTAMAIVTAAYSGKDDAYAKTAQRVMVAPVSVKAIVLCKIISCTLIFTFCSMFVLMIAAMLWKLKIYRSITELFILYTGIAFMVSAIGTYIGLGMKNFLAIKNVMTVPIGIFAVAAGTFFPIGTLSVRMQYLMNLSPLTWINRCVFLVLYDNSFYMIWLVAGVLIAIGATFTMISVKSFKKEEYINGDLPGYEK